MIFETVNDANMRLCNSVIMYKDSPVYVNMVDGEDRPDGIRLYIQDLITEEDTVVFSSDTDLNFKPVKVGYANRPDTACYITRVPVRKWKQGLHRDNLHWSNDTDCEANRLMLRIEFEILKSRYLGDCIIGKYPSLEECIESVSSNKVYSKAWCRSFAISRDVSGLLWLKYRGNRVGWMDSTGPILSPDFKYLKEELQEVI